jgi:hypothetical protein
MMQQEQVLIPQTGAAAIWRLEQTPVATEQEALVDTCKLHAWTCIWCSMTPPICGSCRPVTPPCPANDRIHTCACRARGHDRAAAA